MLPFGFLLGLLCVSSTAFAFPSTNDDDWQSPAPPYSPFDPIPQNYELTLRDDVIDYSVWELINDLRAARGESPTLPALVPETYEQSKTEIIRVSQIPPEDMESIFAHGRSVIESFRQLPINPVFPSSPEAKEIQEFDKNKQPLFPNGRPEDPQNRQNDESRHKDWFRPKPEPSNA